MVWQHCMYIYCVTERSQVEGLTTDHNQRPVIIIFTYNYSDDLELCVFFRLFNKRPETLCWVVVSKFRVANERVVWGASNYGLCV